MNKEFVEGSHYYYDRVSGAKGTIVFTETYHIERGYCCGNGCRHCPYDPRHERGSKQIAITDKKNYYSTS